MKFTGIKCPKCGKKGLMYASAFGLGREFLNYGVITCRYCFARFNAEKLEAKIESERK